MAKYPIGVVQPPRAPRPGYMWKGVENRWVEVVDPKSKLYTEFVSTAGSYSNLSTTSQAGFAQELFNAEVKSTLLSRSSYKITDLIGEGPISGFFRNTGTYGADPLTSTYFDGVRVRNLNGSYNFNLTGIAEKNGNDAFEFNYTLGTPNQLEISGYSKNETFIALSSNTRVAKMPPGVGGSKDLVTTILKKEFPDTIGLKITFRVPALFNMNDEGKKSGLQILYSIKGAKDNGPEVDLLPSRTVTIWNPSTKKREEVVKKFGAIVGLANSAYLTTRNVFHISLAEKWTTYRIRIVRESENAVSERTPSELYVDSIAVIGSNKFSYPSSALVALSINSDNFSQVPARAYDIMGLLVSIPEGYTPPRIKGDGTYTTAIYPAIWTGTFSSQKQWTNNPAWIFYDIITNKRYGLGNYLNENLIDKWSLYEIAKYCDEMVSDGNGGTEPRFTCNAVIQGAKAAYDLLQDLVSIFQGMMYWGNGKIWVNTSKLYPTVYNFTNANVIDGRFLYSDTARNTRSTVIKIKWRDPDLLYREDIVKLEDVNGIQKYGYIEKEIESFGCTSRGQAIRAAEFILQSERNLTETVTFQTALEGLYMRPGDNFNIYDNFVNNKNQGGRILSISSGNKLIKLDRDISINSQRTYELSLINPVFNADPTGITGSDQFQLLRNSQIEKRNIESYNSGNSSITVSSAFSNGVQNGAVWMLNCTSTGEYNESSRLFRCLATAELQPGIIEILGVEANTGIVYSSSTGYSSENVFYETPVLQPINPPSNLNVSIYSGINNGAFQYDPLLTWSGSDSSNVAGYIISGKIATGDFYDIGETTNTSYLADFSSSGYYQYRVAAVSDEGVYSSFITGGILFSVTNNPLGGPPIISGVVSEDEENGSYGTTGYVDRGILFSWELEAGEDGYYSPKTVFFSGYQVSILNPTTNAVLLTENINDIGNRIYSIAPDILTGLGLSGRLVKTRIVVVDTFGNKTSPVDTVFNNPPPRPPVSSGFYQMQGGLQFSIQPSPLDIDISGCYLWTNSTLPFTPTFNNPTKTFSITEGFLQNSFSTDFYTWFSLIDTFGTTGSTIYGPILISASSSPFVTGIASPSSPMLRGGVNFSGVGGVRVTQNNGTNTILVSGERPYFNLGFFLNEMPDETGVAIGELISSRPFIFTGYSVSCRTVGSSNLSGNFYYCGLDNSSTVSLGNFGLVAGQTNRTQGLPFANVPASRKIGYNLTSLANSSQKVSIGLFGYEVT